MKLNIACGAHGRAEIHLISNVHGTKPNEIIGSVIGTVRMQDPLAHFQSRASVCNFDGYTATPVMRA